MLAELAEHLFFWEHLKDNIAKILAQDYPAFEVIVVNDQSSDNTANVLFSHRYFRYYRYDCNFFG